MVNDKYKEKYEKIKIELIKILIVSKDRTLKEVEIINKLGINQGKDKKTLRKIFNKLIQDSVIAVDRNNRSVRLKTKEYEVGEIVLNGMNDFAIDFSDRRNSIKSSNLKGAYVGDIVLYSNKDKSIKSVIKKANNPRIFECIRVNDKIEILPFNLRESEKYRFFSDKPLNLTGNEIISAYVIKNEEENCFDCHIKEVLGKRTEYNISGKIMLAMNGLDINFPEEVLEEAKLIPDHVLESEIEGRIDLRELPTFTIDSSKRTETFDDAMSVATNKEGHYLLYIHVIDVAHYVKPGSKIFEEAIKRAKKIYMHNYGYTYNMLPDNLSTGICSLTKGQDRLTKTISLEFSEDGELLEYDYFNSVIHVDRNYDSKQAERVYDAFLDDTNSDYDPFFALQFILFDRVNQFIKMSFDKNHKLGSIVKFSYYCYSGDGSKNVLSGPFSKSDDSMQERVFNSIKFANEQVSNHFPTLPFIYKTFEYPSKKEIISASKLDWFIHDDLDSYIKKDIVENILHYYDLPNTQHYRLAVMHLLVQERYLFSVNNRGNYKKGVARYTQVNSPARSSICLVNQTLFDKYSGDFDTDSKSLERSEKRLESICTNYNEKSLKYERLQKLHPSPSEKAMSVVENVTTGIVLGRNGNTFIISTKDGEMYYVTAGNTKVEIGDKVIVQLFKSIDDSKNQKVKILCNKNNSNNI